MFIFNLLVNPKPLLCVHYQKKSQNNNVNTNHCFVFQQGMMAVRIDVIPSTGFPGMPFNGQRACFLMKNMTTFDQTVKELHTRGQTKVEYFNVYIHNNALTCAHIFVHILLL